MTGFLCALPLVAGLLACAAPDVLAVGYVEGEYVHLAPVTAAELAEVAVRQGDRVDAGRDRRPPGAHRRRDRARRGRGGARPGRGRARQPARGQPAGGDPRHRGRARGGAGPAPRGRAPGRPADRAGSRRGVVPQANLDTAVAARDTAAHRGRRARGASSPSSGCPPAPRWSPPPRAGSQGAEAAVRDAAWQLGQARSRRRRSPARSPTSSAAPARSPGRPSRSSRSCPTAPTSSWSSSARPTVAGIAPGSRARGPLRRLPGRPDRHRVLRLRRAGVHAAGDLLGREPPEARLPRRGAAAAGEPASCGRDRSSMSRSPS